ncbi:HAMP domain-containing sensor histidine kinase [Desulfitobacterium sp. THU1]|uniref:sensor histidine kinase n=1 Tax=Desulfitobacterium sp. THU1 TaxID=3138072 RepID=UPI00311DCF7A
MNDRRTKFIILEKPGTRKFLTALVYYLVITYVVQYGMLALDASFKPPEMLTPFWLGTFACGVCFMIAVYSLSLYIQKSSERYLLWLFYIALITCLRTLLGTVGNASPAFSTMETAFNIFIVVTCYALCFWLTDTKLPGRWNFFLTARGLLLIYLVLLIIRFSWPDTTLQRFIATLPYAVALFCLGQAYIAGKKQALPLLVGLAARFGLRGYLLLAIGPGTPENSLSHFVVSSQLDFLAFVFACMFVINAKFVTKFNESDKLVVQLEAINANLDSIVAQRTKELQQANETIIAQHKRSNTLMTNIFHDLRSPLFVLRGYLDMPLTGEEGEKRVTVMRERSAFLNHLIEELFLVARLEEGEIHFESELIDVSRSYLSALEAVRPAADKQGISLSFNGEGKIVGDAFRLEQALQNLLENAIKYTPAGGKVRISCEQRNDTVIISISDTGVGIPAEELPLLFDRYYQSSRGGKRVNSSGLGLYIVDQIIKGMGGNIVVTSTPGDGSTFTLTLPAKIKEIG